MKPTTKFCPKCGNDKLILLPSMDKKVCMNHGRPYYIEWKLDVGQQPIFSYSQRIGR